MAGPSSVGASGLWAPSASRIENLSWDLCLLYSAAAHGPHAVAEACPMPPGDADLCAGAAGRSQMSCEAASSPKLPAELVDSFALTLTTETSLPLAQQQVRAAMLGGCLRASAQDWQWPIICFPPPPPANTHSRRMRSPASCGFPFGPEQHDQPSFGCLQAWQLPLQPR